MFDLGHWYAVSQCDARVVCHYLAHYSSEKSGRKGTQFAKGITGQGETMTLLTADSLAAWLWLRQQIRDDEQSGVCCTLFRNTGPVLSSELVQQADALAWDRWPGERHFTFINPAKVRSSNPGYCFLSAGWRRCGTTKGGLVILDILPVMAGGTSHVSRAAGDRSPSDPITAISLDSMGVSGGDHTRPAPSEPMTFRTNETPELFVAARASKE